MLVGVSNWLGGVIFLISSVLEKIFVRIVLVLWVGVDV